MKALFLTVSFLLSSNIFNIKSYMVNELDKF